MIAFTGGAMLQGGDSGGAFYALDAAHQLSGFSPKKLATGLALKFSIAT